MILKKKVFIINGVERMFMCDPENDKLSDVIRRLGLTGCKVGCGIGVCGSCNLIINGKVERSCNKKITAIEDYSEITTIEGIGTPQHLHPLQQAWISYGAVQCGFCVPGFIVSAYALLQQNNNPTREEVRDWFQKTKNVCRCTGYKQIVDAVMAAAKVVRGEWTMEDLTARNPKEGEFLGKPLMRPDGLGKVCGLTDYGDDQALKMPAGVLQAAVIQPRISHHAKILAIHTEEAEKMPGVVKVILAKDLIAAGGTNIMAEGQFHERSTVLKPSRKVFQDEKLHRWGDVVGMVVADTRQHARDAAAKVTVDIEELPAALTYLEAVMPDAVRVHEDTPNIFAEQPVLKGVGLEDPEKVKDLIDNAPNVVEGSFMSSREPHLSIEGCVLQTYWADDGMLTVQCKSQCVYSSIGRLGNCLGVPKNKYRIIMNPTGASFGWSTNAGDIALCAACTVVTGEPVSLSMSYEEHQHFSGKRCPSYSNGRLACDENGRIIAAEFDYGMDHGAYSWGGDDVMTKPARFAFFPYYVPNVAGLVRVANVNHAFGTAYRSYGSPQAYTLSEPLMDMMAEKLGMDPFEFRYKNIARPGETNINSYEFMMYPMEKIMDTMKPYYEAALKRAKELDTPEKKRGVGLAWGGFNVTEGESDVAEAAIEMKPDGKFVKYDTWHAMGQGGSVGSLMVTLEALKELHLKPEDIQLVQNDTKLCPDSGMAGASRSFYMSGNATIIAAKKLLDAMRKEDGTFRTYEEMVAEGIPTKYTGRYETTATPGLCKPDPNTGIGNPSPAYTYCLNLAEIEVDMKTGKVVCDKFTCVDDIGTIGNIDAVNGQAYSGIMHGIGFALKEDYSDVKKHGNMASAGTSYIKDVPDDITVVHVDSFDKWGPFGGSGSSEAFQASGHCAVLNAIYNACGVRIHEIPALPAKVKAGIDAIEKGEKPYDPGKYFLGSDLYEELEEIHANPVRVGGSGYYVSLDDPTAERPF